MDYLELLYADRIRTLAMEKQKTARKAAKNAAGDAWDDRVDQWEYENPLPIFIEDVHEELVAISSHLRQL